MSALPSQTEFCSLSIPDFHNVDSMPNEVEHEVFSRTGSSHSAKGQTSTEQGTNVSLDFESAASALAEVSNAIDEDDLHSEEAQCVSHAVHSTSHFDPERILPNPVILPKRFCRTFWRSITLRLVNKPATDPAPLPSF
jgi:hypothetical protein